MSVDAIGDFLTIIRNGIMASKPFVVAPYSKIRAEIAQILKDEGFIKDVSIVDQDDVKKSLKVVLKYVKNESVIHEIKRQSRPGLRLYKGIDSVKPVIGGLGISILTTNRGVVTHKKAKELGVGGEVLCTIW
jgi:small subunit ribosomal protein S8